MSKHVKLVREVAAIVRAGHTPRWRDDSADRLSAAADALETLERENRKLRAYVRKDARRTEAVHKYFGGGESGLVSKPTPEAVRAQALLDELLSRRRAGGKRGRG